MRAAVYTGAGGTEVIAFHDRPDPAPGDDEIVIRVRAAGLNRADLLQRMGRYPAPAGWPADIPGLEYAGEVLDVGRRVTRWHPGERAMGLVGGGAHAERVVVHQDEALVMPAGMAFHEAAAIPEAFITAFDALTIRARIDTGDRVLIHAAASGLGTAAVQLAKYLGATVVGTSRSAGKLVRLAEYGLDHAIDTSRGPFREALDAPVDVILDVLGAEAFVENVAALAPRGRLVLLGTLTGGRGDADLGMVLRKRIQVIGTVMRSREREERLPLMRTFGSIVGPLFESGAEPPALRPVIGTVLPMQQLDEAHDLMARNETFGKVVLEW
jgi:putative PIG3 family NAD(P)H quinone oxidoreductase